MGVVLVFNPGFQSAAEKESMAPKAKDFFPLENGTTTEHQKEKERE
jgi:hypothetical protein